MMELAVNAIVFALGVGLVAFTLSSAIRTFVLPRGEYVLLTAAIFQGFWAIFRLRVKLAKTRRQRERLLAMYAPTTLLLVPIVWLLLAGLGFMAMFWAIGVRPLGEAFLLSGSSLLTLGFSPVTTMFQTVLAFLEATIGLVLIALLIAYLPTMYASFSRRETLVAKLEVYAGLPPSPVEIIARMHRIRGIEFLRELYILWETWFSEIEESQTTFGPLNFFRSPKPERSWVTAAGAILDSASLVLSALDIPREPHAALCIRSGYLALRSIADFFGFEYDRNPAPDASISISREEFEEALDQLQNQGVDLLDDRDQAWQDFSGWRVNYDATLLALAAISLAPTAPWSSDRAKLLPTRQNRSRFFL